MKSEIQIKRTVIHADYAQMQTNLFDGKLVLRFEDRKSTDRVVLRLDEDDVQILLGHLLLNDPDPTPKIHGLFRNYPRLHRLLTEALLTFDNEAGGETMNIKTAPAEKEEQP